jgi:hypothetical protein
LGSSLKTSALERGLGDYPKFSEELSNQ